MIRSAFRISKWMGGHILTSSSSILSSSYVLWNLEAEITLKLTTIDGRVVTSMVAAVITA